MRPEPKARSPGTRKAAFFDVDNTLLNVKSMFSFQAFYLDTWRAGRGDDEDSYAAFIARFEGHPHRHDRQALNRLFYRGYAGHRERDLQAAARAWFEQLQASEGPALWIQPALEMAWKLRASGHLLVAVSGSSQDILAPVHEKLGFDHCLATRLQTHDGLLTGEIIPPQMIGPGKGEAMRRFAVDFGIDLASSVACGDHITDLPMLDSVGTAVVVAGDAELEAVARARGWAVLQVTPSIREGRLVHV